MSIRGPRLEFAVGAFLLLGLASLLVLALASSNGKFGFGQATYPLSARFTNLGQLRPDAPVKIGGVTIGSVAAIQLDPVKLDAVVTLEIDERYTDQIGRETCRERVCQYVWISVGAGYVKKKSDEERIK